MLALLKRGRFGNFDVCHYCVIRHFRTSTTAATSTINVCRTNALSKLERTCSSSLSNRLLLFSPMYRRHLLFAPSSAAAVDRRNFSAFSAVGDGRNRLLLFASVGKSTGVILLTRNMGSIARLARMVLKIRYLILGGAVGVGVTIAEKFEQLKEMLPDLSWLKDYLPQSEHFDRIAQKWRYASARWRERRETLAIRWRETNEPGGWFAEKRHAWAGWLDDVLKSEGGGGFARGLLLFNGVTDWDSLDSNAPALPEAEDVLIALTDLPLAGSSTASAAADRSSGSSSMMDMTEKERYQKLQDDLMQTQAKYQKELERLEKENKELRRQLLLRNQHVDKRRKVQKSLIDMYSEALDTLIDYDSSYCTQDHLPRVIVVGDQSSGKTSVLEMIAQARIFPRGSGEMMTRAPVKVTLSEGPYHVAQFRDSQREFDLAKEIELAELRKEIELRMKNSVQEGKTVSNEVISLTVKGPGLPRMVLVDLPGVISTVTSEMARETKDDIVRICRTYMENPNAIILCIQDGSVDAERSNVTDLVSSMDPAGKRTILVLTKVDLAEDSLSNPDRIKKILEGKLFPMKALGYFAVVTGRGNTNDSIDVIKKYEDQFFANSKLFRDGVLKPSQMTTQNMSMAVSDCFWKMVKESIEQQADAFKATRFNLETEWKNTFPRQRELNRDELFEKARGEILDEIINLSQITAKQWEDALQKKLWDKVSYYLFESVFIPAALAESVGTFNTTVDIKLKHWADTLLPKKCVEVGWETLRDQFQHLMQQDSQAKDHDSIFDPVKNAVVEQAMNHHIWDKKAGDYLRVIQLNALEDRSVPDKQSWDHALAFMEGAVRERLKQTERIFKELKGPGSREQWLHWKAPMEVHVKRQAAEQELQKILNTDPDHKPTLAPDEITMVRKNLQAKNLEVPGEEIREVWHHTYRQHFLRTALASTRECRNFFYHYQKGLGDTEVDCNAVVLFWRVQRMLQITGNSLRQQITNTEARRLEKEIKEVLDEWSQDAQMKKQLLTGRRVELAEELRQVRQIQEKLEEFIQSLNQEKA